MTNTTGTTTSGSSSITSVANTTNIVVIDANHPQYVYGAGIAFGANVSSISGSTVVMSANATGPNTGLTFYFPAPAASPGLGPFASTTNGANSVTLASTTTTGDTKNNKAAL